MSAPDLVEVLDRLMIDVAAGRLSIPAGASVERRPRSIGGDTLKIHGWTAALGPLSVLTNANGEPTDVAASITEATVLRRSDLPASWGDGQIIVDDEGGGQRLSFDVAPAGDRRHVVVSAQLDDFDESVIVAISMVPFQMAS